MAFDQWKPPLKGVFFKKIWCAIFFIMVWTLWKERNERCFSQSFNSLNHLKELVLMRSSWWVKGWDTTFPYGANEIIRNPKCLMWSETPPLMLRPHATAQPQNWIPPPPGSLKWNVDASLNQELMKSSIGGVLRDHLGHFKCLFSSQSRSWISTMRKS